MKKLIILFTLLVMALAVYSQLPTVIKYKLDAVALTEKGSTGEQTLPIISGEYDVSVQMIPAQVAGDSLDLSHIIYLSNSYDADAWTAVSVADTISSLTDYDCIAWWADLKPLRIKIEYTAISVDSKTITTYVVYKKHANE